MSSRPATRAAWLATVVGVAAVRSREFAPAANGQSETTSRKQVIPLSSATVIVIVVAIIVVVALVSGLLLTMRRRRLRQRFGPEYDRLVAERGSKRAAEAELAQRERRARGLDTRPLTSVARERYASQWAAIQERFVDAPAEAVAASQALVTAVMAERGYPTENLGQVLADLSVDHRAAVDHYRAADEISSNSASGAASTEDLRIAMIHYRELFRDLLGDPDTDPADAGSGAAAASGRQAAGREPNPAVPPPADTADAQRPVTANDVSADRRANGSVDRMPGN